MSERNWEWWEKALQHPDGRAEGGEPCVVCEESITAGIHWKWRDRHVCSSRCNRNLRRRLNRAIAAAKVDQPPTPPPAISIERPAYFGTDLDEPFPFGHGGLSPRVGDVVDRFGSITTYHRAEGRATP